MVILDRQKMEARKVFDDKVRELAFKKNIRFDEARKILEAKQSSLGDFRIK